MFALILQAYVCRKRAKQYIHVSCVTRAMYRQEAWGGIGIGVGGVGWLGTGMHILLVHTYMCSRYDCHEQLQQGPNWNGDLKPIP